MDIGQLSDPSVSIAGTAVAVGDIVFVGSGVLVAFGAFVTVGGIVAVGVFVGSNNCPVLQLKMVRLITRIKIAGLYRCVFIALLSIHIFHEELRLGLFLYKVYDQPAVIAFLNLDLNWHLVCISTRTQFSTGDLDNIAGD